ncbi:MAG: DUF4943 family protein [Bacteroidota bacterium]|nr:DUF4943 family protein [Bacteroidota bacterium]
MKSLVLFALLSVMCLGCERSSFDVNNPDVEEFVKQLKDGTYDRFAQTENGERLWAVMPSFTKEDVPALILLSKDTDLVTPCDHFPVNPISSMIPYRVVDGKECIMLGEYLLWCAEAVLEGKDFASLNPVLVNVNDTPYHRLGGRDILSVRNIYQEWWDEYGHLDNPGTLPLDGTSYQWH